MPDTRERQQQRTRHSRSKRHVISGLAFLIFTHQGCAFWWANTRKSTALCCSSDTVTSRKITGFLQEYYINVPPSFLANLEFYFICLYLLITHYILKFCITACVWVCVCSQIGKSEAIISLRNDVTFPNSFSYYSYKSRALDIFVLHIALINKALDFTEVVLYACFLS